SSSPTTTWPRPSGSAIGPPCSSPARSPSPPRRPSSAGAPRSDSTMPWLPRPTPSAPLSPKERGRSPGRPGVNDARAARGGVTMTSSLPAHGERLRPYSPAGRKADSHEHHDHVPAHGGDRGGQEPRAREAGEASEVPAHGHDGAGDALGRGARARGRR